MRIVGGKDYYDSASAYGIDPGITFVRDNRIVTNGDAKKMGTWLPSILTLVEDIEEPQDPPKGWRRPSVSSDRHYWGNSNNRLYGDEYTITGHNVLFCGKVYTGFTIRVGSGRNLLEKEVTHFWTASRLEKWAAERKLIAKPSQYWNSTLEDLFKVGSISDTRLQTHIEMGIAIAWKKEAEEHSNSPYNTDAYNALDSGWRINPDGLKEIGFQSAVDPVTAFQELSMWVGGTLSSKGPAIVEITDDKIKVAKHGFDKWSFRKQGKNSKV